MKRIVDGWEDDSSLQASGWVAELTSTDDVQSCELSDMHLLVAPYGSAERFKQWIRKAIASGKHIVSELPPFFAPADLNEAAELCKRSGVRWTVVFPERFDGRYVNMKQKLDSGKIGHIGVMHLNSKSPFPADRSEHDSVVRGLMLKDLALAHWFGGPVRNVYAMRVTVQGLDCAFVTLRFRSGAIAQLRACQGDSEEAAQAIELAGTGGIIRYDSVKARSIIVKKRYAADLTATEPLAALDRRRALRRSFSSAVADLQAKDGGPEAGSGLEDAYAVLELARAAEKSIRTRQPVPLDSTAGK